MEREEIKKYQRLLIQYLRENYPGKLILNPRVCEVNNTHIKFGMRKHFGVLTISKTILESNLKKNLF